MGKGHGSSAAAAAPPPKRNLYFGLKNGKRLCSLPLSLSLSVGRSAFRTIPRPNVRLGSNWVTFVVHNFILRAGNIYHFVRRSIFMKLGTGALAHSCIFALDKLWLQGHSRGEGRGGDGRGEQMFGLQPLLAVKPKPASQPDRNACECECECECEGLFGVR